MTTAIPSAVREPDDQPHDLHHDAHQEPSSQELRERMVAELIESGVLTDARIEEAFRAVPRERFCPPGTPLEAPYAIHDVVHTRKDTDGITLSSLSAPYMQAGNLQQLSPEPGTRVLEIGSGGPMAAMLAHLVGPSGQVVTVDIDQSVTDRARAGLDALDLPGDVEVVTADAGLPLGRGVFDRIIVTVAAWTIPPAWLDQLAPGGVLVVPLRLAPGMQRILAFVRDGDHLRAGSVVLGGFVFMQGTHQHTPPAIDLTGPSSGKVTFSFAEQIPDGFAVTDTVLASDPVEAWSEVTYRNNVVWVDILAWILLQPGGCSITAENTTDLGHARAFFPGLTDGASYAAICWRPHSDLDGHVQVGAVGKGLAAQELCDRLRDALQQYDHYHRGTDPVYRYWPGRFDPPAEPAIGHAVRNVLPRPHGVLTIDWPAHRPASTQPQ